MDKIFIVKLLVSFLIGSFWAVMTTILADKFGSKIGGLIAGLPSTTLFSLFFIAWTQSPKIASQSTLLIPLILSISTLFLSSYVLLVQKNFWLSLLISYFIWFTLSFIAVFFKFSNFSLGLMVYLFIFITCFYILENVLKLPSKKGSKIKYSWPMILLRAMIGGGIIALATLMAKIAGPVIGGVFSAFPAMYSATLLITYFSQGPSFSASTMKTGMLGATAVVLYSVIARFSYQNYGLIIGTLIPIFISYIYGYFLYKVVIEKIS